MYLRGKFKCLIQEWLNISDAGLSLCVFSVLAVSPLYWVSFNWPFSQFMVTWDSCKWDFSRVGSHNLSWDWAMERGCVTVLSRADIIISNNSEDVSEVWRFYKTVWTCWCWLVNDIGWLFGFWLKYQWNCIF